LRMKEVCDRTGLTDRAVRLYIENGLLSPTQESSYTGRKSILFSDGDVDILRAIAALRQADFSLADIREMQTDTQKIPGILAAHRELLLRDIAAKQQIVRVLETIRPDDQTDYTGVAEMIRSSASAGHLPEEETGMLFHDLQKNIRHRIPALAALLLMVIGAVYYFPLLFRTILMGSMSVQSEGGGYSLNLAFSWAAVMQCWPLLLAGVLYIGGIALLFIHVLNGKKPLLFAAGGICLLMVVLFLLLPGELRDKLYLHEFLRYRYSFMHGILYSASEGFDRFIRTLKIVPPLVSAVLSMIGAMTDRERE